jgi:hypothetical protein
VAEPAGQLPDPLCASGGRSRIAGILRHASRKVNLERHVAGSFRSDPQVTSAVTKQCEKSAKVDAGHVGRWFWGGDCCRRFGV